MGKSKNTILDYLKGCDGELYGRIVRTLKVYRGIDFEAIGQEDVMGGESGGGDEVWRRGGGQVF